MKVAYNGCFGGFGLSPLALTAFAKKKGIDLTWYEQVGYKHEGNEKYTKLNKAPEGKGNLFGFKPLINDLGEEISKIPEGKFYYPEFYDNARSDPDLISVIESLGDKADGMCAALRIATIPDGVEFEIDEYDGNESVVPPRSSW